MAKRNRICTATTHAPCGTPKTSGGRDRAEVFWIFQVDSLGRAEVTAQPWKDSATNCAWKYSLCPAWKHNSLLSVFWQRLSFVSSRLTACWLKARSPLLFSKMRRLPIGGATWPRQNRLLNQRSPITLAMTGHLGY